MEPERKLLDMVSPRQLMDMVARRLDVIDVQLDEAIQEARKADHHDIARSLRHRRTALKGVREEVGERV